MFIQMKNYCQIGTWENIIAKDICVKIWHQNCPPTSEAQNWVTKPARKMCFLFRMVFFFWMSIPFFDWPQIMVALYIFYYIVNTTMYSQYTYISYTLKNNPFFFFQIYKYNFVIWGHTFYQIQFYMLFFAYRE